MEQGPQYPIREPWHPLHYFLIVVGAVAFFLQLAWLSNWRPIVFFIIVGSMLAGTAMLLGWRWSKKLAAPLAPVISPGGAGGCMLMLIMMTGLVGNASFVQVIYYNLVYPVDVPDSKLDWLQGQRA